MLGTGWDGGRRQDKGECGVWQQQQAIHIGLGVKHTYLSDLLDLTASFPNERTTLTGGDHKSQGNRWPARGRAVSH